MASLGGIPVESWLNRSQLASLTMLARRRTSPLTDYEGLSSTRPLLGSLKATVFLRPRTCFAINVPTTRSISAGYNLFENAGPSHFGVEASLERAIVLGWVAIHLPINAFKLVHRPQTFWEIKEAATRRARHTNVTMHTVESYFYRQCALFQAEFGLQPSSHRATAVVPSQPEPSSRNRSPGVF